MKKIDIVQFVFVISIVGLIASCAATEPPPLPPNNPADPQVGSSSKAPRNVLVRDETTLAIEKQLSATKADTKSAESMKHDMQNMPGMQHDGMKMKAAAAIYTCRMHPQIQSDKPGKCPICGMQLVKEKQGQ